LLLGCLTRRRRLRRSGRRHGGHNPPRLRRPGRRHGGQHPAGDGGHRLRRLPRSLDARRNLRDDVNILNVNILTLLRSGNSLCDDHRRDILTRICSVSNLCNHRRDILALICSVSSLCDDYRRDVLSWSLSRSHNRRRLDSRLLSHNRRRRDSRLLELRGGLLRSRSLGRGESLSRSLNRRRLDSGLLELLGPEIVRGRIRSLGRGESLSRSHNRRRRDSRLLEVLAPKVARSRIRSLGRGERGGERGRYRLGNVRRELRRLCRRRRRLQLLATLQLRLQCRHSSSSSSSSRTRHLLLLFFFIRSRRVGSQPHGGVQLVQPPLDRVGTFHVILQSNQGSIDVSQYDGPCIQSDTRECQSYLWIASCRDSAGAASILRSRSAKPSE
jgi:hypothetical protein